MKIYPSTHKIKTVTDSHVDTDLNIPLAYIDVDYSKYKIEKTVDTNFNTENKTPILIDDTFDNIDIKIFNSYDEEVKTEDLLVNNNGTYTYRPKSLIDFEPKFFLWKATVKKQLEYKISNYYNLNIKCYDDSVDELLNSVFTNPSERSLLPPNIKINKNKMTYDTFTNLSNEEADFVFIKNYHGGYYDADCLEQINIYDYLDNHTNLWIASEDPRSINSEYNILTASENQEYTLNNPIINSNSKIYCKTYFDLGLITNKTGIKVHNIFNNSIIAPILILEYESSGFLIISHSSILNNIKENYSIIFEVLMYVYLNSYSSTSWIKEWITYNVPDFEVVNNKLQSKNNFISTINLNTYFNTNDSNMTLVNIKIKDDETIKTSVDTSNDLTNSLNAIKCIGQINSKLIFELDPEITLEGYTEPTKPVGWKSIYYKGKIYYLNTIHYLIKNDLNEKIFLIENDDNLIVKIYAFKNSLLGININKDISFSIPFIKAQNEVVNRIKEANYTIYIKDNIINYCYSEDYDESIENQYKLFTISIGQTEEAISIYDLRQLGGGLPEGEEDNFNLFDIGHINGRPYRNAGTLVITMPKKYEKHKDKILKVINKYIVGEDYPVIFFEDKEE